MIAKMEGIPPHFPKREGAFCGQKSSENCFVGETTAEEFYLSCLFISNGVLMNEPMWLLYTLLTLNTG